MLLDNISPHKIATSPNVPPGDVAELFAPRLTDCDNIKQVTCASVREVYQHFRSGFWCQMINYELGRRLLCYRQFVVLRTLS